MKGNRASVAGRCMDFRCPKLKASEVEYKRVIGNVKEGSCARTWPENERLACGFDDDSFLPRGLQR